MKVISMINYKGGVGKTTLTANIGTEMAKRGYKVLLIDLDPQASLTFSFMKVDDWRDNYEGSMTIKHFLDDYIDETNTVNLRDLIIRPESINSKIDGSLDFICSHLGLINIDIDLAVKMSGTPKHYRRNFVKVMSILKKGLLNLDEEYDYVLIDCPPNFNIVTKNALIASDFYMVPTRLDFLSTLGIGHLNQHMNDLVKQYNLYSRGNKKEYPKVNPCLIGIICNMVGIYSGELISVNKHYLEEMKKSNYPLFDTYIKESKTLISDTSEYGVPLVLKDSTKYNDIRLEIELLTDEVFDKVGVLCKER